MVTKNQLQDAPRVYRTLNDENAQYKKLVFELRKGEMQYFTFKMDKEK